MIIINMLASLAIMINLITNLIKSKDLNPEKHHDKVTITHAAAHAKANSHVPPPSLDQSFDH
jgi:hypothetical protein